MRLNPDLKVTYAALRALGNPAKLVTVTIMRKLIETANALVKADRNRTPKIAWSRRTLEGFNGRIQEVLQFHHFRFGEGLKTTLHRYAPHYNLRLPQSALGRKTLCRR